MVDSRGWGEWHRVMLMYVVLFWVCVSDIRAIRSELIKLTFVANFAGPHVLIRNTYKRGRCRRRDQEVGRFSYNEDGENSSARDIMFSHRMKMMAMIVADTAVELACLSRLKLCSTDCG